MASRQFQRATKELEQTRSSTQPPEPAIHAECIPDAVAQALDGSVKAEVEEWNKHAFEFEQKRREFFTKLVGAERATRSAAEAFGEDRLPPETMYGQAVAKKPKDGQQEQEQDLDQAMGVPHLHYGDDNDEEETAPAEPTLDERKRKAITESECSIVNRRGFSKSTVGISGCKSQRV